LNENLNCKSCSKESYAKVPVTRVIEKLDELFSRNDLPAVGRLLTYWENEARILKDERGLLEILNEEIGYFRRIADKEKGIKAVNEAFSLIESKSVCDIVTKGTIYLNGATTMKSFGMAQEAMPYYEKARELYLDRLEPDDYRLAAFYNNISSAYKDIGDIKNAESACYAAIEILERKGGYLGEIAVSLVNIAHLYHDKDPFDERVNEIMERAWKCLSSDKNEHDGNFAFICSKCYPSFDYFGYFEQASELKELTESIYAGN